MKICCPLCGRGKTRVSDIQAVVASYYHLSPRDMRSARRSRDIARPRQVAMFLARENTLYSLPQIGRLFGKRDHTTVMHAIKRISELVVADAQMAVDVAMLRDRLA